MPPPCVCYDLKLPVFLWRSHIPKLKIAFPSEVLVSSDYRPYRKNLAFYNVIARQGSSFWISKLLRCLTWLKWLPEKAVAWVKNWVIIAMVFANWTILVLEEIFISTCRGSRVIRLRFNSATQRQMFLLLYGGHICAPPRRLHTNSPPNNSRMKNSRDLILGEVVYIFIIYHIPYSELNLLNGYDF